MFSKVTPVWPRSCQGIIFVLLAFIVRLKNKQTKNVDFFMKLHASSRFHGRNTVGYEHAPCKKVFTMHTNLLASIKFIPFHCTSFHTRGLRRTGCFCSVLINFRYFFSGRVVYGLLPHSRASTNHDCLYAFNKYGNRAWKLQWIGSSLITQLDALQQKGNGATNMQLNMPTRGQSAL